MVAVPRSRGMRAELSDVELQIHRITEAIAVGGLLTSLVNALQARHERQSDLRRAIDAAQSAIGLRIDRAAVEAEVCLRLTRWRSMLTAHAAEGRQFLREALNGPIRFKPVGRTYEFTGELSTGALLAGAVTLPTNVVPVRGFEPRSRG